MNGITFYGLIIELLNWLKANILTIIISAGVPIGIQLLQFRKLTSETRKLERETEKLGKEAEKLDVETEGIAIKSANEALGVWDKVVEKIQKQTDDCVSENVRLREQIERLSSELVIMDKRQNFLVATIQSIIHVFSEIKPDTLCILNNKGMITFVSLNIGGLLGFDVNEFTNKSIYELFHPDDRAQNIVLFNQLILIPNMTMANRFRLRARNNEYLWIEIVGTNLIEHDRINGILISLRDITERRGIEEKFKQTYLEIQ